MAEVETGDSGPGVPGPSSPLTEGSGEPVPDSAMSHHSITEEAGASLSHPSTAGLMGATLRAPIAGSSQMLGTTGAVVNPDVQADIEHDLALEAGIEARPSQPPHPSLVVDVPSGYPEDLGISGTPDTVNIEDILSVDVTPLSSISISVMDSTPCSDMSVAKSVSVDLSTSMSVDFGDRTRGIQDAAATSELADPPIGAARRFRNPSILTFQYSARLAGKRLFMPPKLGFWGNLIPYVGCYINQSQKGTLLRESTSFEPSSVKISQAV